MFDFIKSILVVSNVTYTGPLSIMVEEKIPQTNGNAEGESCQVGLIWREQDILLTRQSECSGILREQASQQTHDIVEMLFWCWADI